MLSRDRRKRLDGLFHDRTLVAFLTDFLGNDVAHALSACRVATPGDARLLHRPPDEVSRIVSTRHA